MQTIRERRHQNIGDTAISEISLSSKNDLPIKSIMKKAGYIGISKISDTLQGCIYRAVQECTNKRVVIKETNKDLHSKGITMINGKKIKIDENILMEKGILKYLSKDKKCPNSIVKYIDAFKSNINYYVVMEDGGNSLFDFVVKAHQFISNGYLEIDEWHKMVKIIFNEMIECIQYIHNKNVCHFDISLENVLINDVHIVLSGNGEKIRFCVDDKHPVQVKLCDFGLAQKFGNRLGLKTNFLCNKYCGKPSYKSPEITNKKERFCGKSNDLWCLGTCLFMMVIGSSPCHKTSKSDKAFIHIINGDIIYLLSKWNRLQYVNKEIIELFHLFFKYEDERVTIEELKQCKWFK